MELIGKYTNKYHDEIYVLFRVFVGLLFAQHGAQKLLGWFTESAPAQLFSLFGLAGTIELVGGLAIVLGIVTRIAALLSMGVMVGAYFTVHVANGLIPIVNRGELAAVYFFCFLVIFAHGAKKLSLEKLIFRRELF